MIVYAGLIPHSPLLLPSIGKRHTKKLRATQKSLQEMSDHIQELHIDVCVLWSPHYESQEAEANSFVISQSQKFAGNLKEFGDLEACVQQDGSVGIVHQWKESLHLKFPIHLANVDELDYASTLAMLTVPALAKGSLIPWGSNAMSRDQHVQFGLETQNFLESIPERVAVIVSGNLSHRLTRKAPGGFSLAGKTYDTMLIKFLRQWDIEAIRNMDDELIGEAGECGHNGLLWELGVLHGKKFSQQILSYESPFGVGYACIEFLLGSFS